MELDSINNLPISIRWEAVGGFRVALWPKLQQAGIDELCSVVSESSRAHALKINNLSRRQEWLAARVLSRVLTGQEPAAGELGNPVWDRGWKGSISHKNGHVALWCSEQGSTIGGVDLESVRELAVGVTAKIMDRDEILICDEIMPKVGTSLIFAAKEAIYKALFPLVRRFFYFEAVALSDLSCAGDDCELVFTVMDALLIPNLTGMKIRVSAKKITLTSTHPLGPQATDQGDVHSDYWLAVAYLPVSCHP
jgi:4'-phosphopantetheinyl transferase EntD